MALTLVAEKLDNVHHSALNMTWSGLPDRKSTCHSNVPSDVCFELDDPKQLMSGGIGSASTRREASRTTGAFDDYGWQIIEIFAAFGFGQLRRPGFQYVAVHEVAYFTL